MLRLVIAIAVGLVASGTLLAQPSRPPRPLPSSLDDETPAKPAGPLSPAEAAKQRADTIKALKEDLRSFDPEGVTARQVEGRWMVTTSKEVLKDFGADKSAATEAALIIRNLRLNQLGSVPGSSPPFEYWLSDGKAPQGVNARLVIVPISARTLRAELVGGTWVLTDGSKGLYDFGTDAEAARQAMVVFWKYGFNQVGVIGAPRPTMMYPLYDARQASTDKAAPLPQPSAVGVFRDVQRTSLLLPGNVYAGRKAPLDLNKLKPVRLDKGEWALAHGDEVLGRFGSSESTARAAAKAIQESKANETVRLGESGWPLFLVNGQPIQGEPLGVQKTRIRAERLKVTKVRDTYWLFEDLRPVMEVGKKEDAEVVLGVIAFFDMKNVSFFGRPEAGGLKLLTAGR